MDENNAKVLEKTKQKIGHRRVTEEGTVTYKRKPTYELQKAIQLGIEVCVSSTQQKPKRDVLLKDFGEIETLEFPKEGSSTLPAHNLSDFKFRNFAPIAFRFFREIYQVDAVDFLNSLCGHDLRELSNAGASGSVFYISHDDEFIIKTVQHKEADFLQKLLPEYYMNLTQHPRTLLPKFYGLYCYQSLGKNIRICVMNNLIPSSIKIHEKYDLKGSTYKRFASSNEKAKSSPTLKDLDFREIHPEGLILEGETYDALTSTIARDCRVLESFRIMDYSLLLAVHNLDEMKREKIRNKIAEDGDINGKSTASQRHKNHSSCHLPTTSTTSSPTHNETSHKNDSAAVTSTSVPSSSSRTSPTPHSSSDPQQSQKKFSAPAVWHRTVKRIAAFSTALESIQANVEPVQLDQEELKSVPPGGIPARNAKGDRLLLFVGIIDILQSYRLTKKMEHTFKAIFHDADTISVHNPAFYATRFQTFITQQVFHKVTSLNTSVVSSNRLSVPFHRVVHMAMKQQSPSRRATTSLCLHDGEVVILSDKDTCMETSQNQNVSAENEYNHRNNSQCLVTYL